MKQMNMETVADWQVLHHIVWRQIIWHYASSTLLLLLLLLLQHLELSVNQLIILMEEAPEPTRQEADGFSES